MYYRFTKQFETTPPQEIWQYLKNVLSKGVVINSIKDGVPYTIHSVDSEAISFSATTRNGGKPDIIKRALFEISIAAIQRMVSFNTNQAKDAFKGGLYRRRSPIFAILLFAKIIESQKT